MADTHETDRPPLTATAAVRDLLARPPAPGRDLVWLADELIRIVQHTGSVFLKVERDEAGSRSLVGGSRLTAHEPIGGRGPVYLFRPLLARLAVLGADEAGGEPQLYGGRYALARSSRDGPVRLEVEFTNTPTAQQLAITRVPVAVPHAPPASDARSASAAPQPSA